MPYTPEEIERMTPAEREAAQERIVQRWLARHRKPLLRELAVLEHPNQRAIKGRRARCGECLAWVTAAEIPFLVPLGEKRYHEACLRHKLEALGFSVASLDVAV